MVKNKKRVIVLIAFISIIFISLSFISAENLNLKITGTVNSITSDVYLKTNSNSNNGIDSYDMFANDLPSGDYSQFYSSVSGNKLSIDSWNSLDNPRNLSLVYHLSNSQTGTLNFSWLALTGNYNATFISYGNDSSYTNLVTRTYMRSTSSYSETINGAYFYAKVLVENYTAPVPFCGDGNCSGTETCSTCPTDCGACPQDTGGNTGGGGGGGGGGGAASSVTSNFNVSTNLIQITIKKGESLKKIIIVKNTAKKSKNFLVKVSPEIKDLFFPSEYNFSLEPGEEKELSFTIAATNDTISGVYPGSIDINSEFQDKKILVVANIKDKSSLFDVSIKIPDNYKKINPGKDLFFEIKLFNFGEIGRVDANVNYLIKDFDGNVIESKDETIAVETQASISRTVKLPADSKPGDYIAIANVKYGNDTASSSDMFQVVGQKTFNFKSAGRLTIIIVIIIIILIALILAYLVKRKALFYKNITSKK
jgi:hypothetical protein